MFHKINPKSFLSNFRGSFQDTAFFLIMQEKMHFSYDFLIRSTRFSYKILYISTRFSDFKSKSSSRCPCSIPEDVPIDLGIIACRIEVAPYCGVIYAALEPLREVLKKSERLIDRAQRRRSSPLRRRPLLPFRRENAPGTRRNLPGNYICPHSVPRNLRACPHPNSRGMLRMLRAFPRSGSRTP